MPAQDCNKGYASLEQSAGARDFRSSSGQRRPLLNARRSHFSQVDFHGDMQQRSAYVLQDHYTIPPCASKGDFTSTRPAHTKTDKPPSTSTSQSDKIVKSRMPGRFPSYQMGPLAPDTSPSTTVEQSLALRSSSTLALASSGGDSFMTAKEEQGFFEDDAGRAKSPTIVYESPSQSSGQGSVVRHSSFQVAGLNKDMPSQEVVAQQAPRPHEQIRRGPKFICSWGIQDAYSEGNDIERRKAASSKRAPVRIRNEVEAVESSLDHVESPASTYTISRGASPPIAEQEQTTNCEIARRERVETPLSHLNDAANPSAALFDDGGPCPDPYRWKRDGEASQESTVCSWEGSRDTTNETLYEDTFVGGLRQYQTPTSPTRQTLEVLTAARKPLTKSGGITARHDRNDSRAEKRLSSNSGSSNVVVEALVFMSESPQPQRPNLRHVSKSAALRGSELDRGSSSHSNERQHSEFHLQENISFEQIKAARYNDSIDRQTYRDSFGLNLSMFSGRARDYSPVRSQASKMLASENKQKSLIGNLPSRLAVLCNKHSDVPAAAGALSSDAFHTDKCEPPSRATLCGRKSSDHSTVNTESVKRSSLEQATTMLPFPKGLTIHRVGAVTIYPYDAKSLLIVQNTSINNSGSTVQATLAPMLMIDGGPVPTSVQLLAASADTPKTLSDSALMRTPAVAVIPPTPISDTRTLASQTSPSRSETPAGQPTIPDRARRYSQDIIAPHILQTPGKRNSLLKQTPRVSEAGFQHRILHPSLRPCYYRNGVPDSGDEEDDYQVGIDAAQPHNPYPVMDKRVSAAQTWRWSDGVWRGNGGSLRGFLIGNTLGLERGPTNKRPHVVDVALVKNRSKVQREDGHSIMQEMRKRLSRKPAVQDGKFERAWRRRMHI